jgi:hypothetical protein
MRLEELVSEANKKLDNEKELIRLKNTFKERYNEVLSVGELIREKEEVKWGLLKGQFEKEAVEFFEEGNFIVSKEGKKYIAKLNDVIIELYYDGEEEMLIYQMQIKPNGIYSAIQIRPCNNHQDMLYWKNIIKLNGKHIYKETLEKELDSCNDKLELISGITKLQENVLHYKNTNDNYEKIKYIYSLYKCSDVECDTFKDLFEKHIG